MLQKVNYNLQSINFVDNVDFSYNDPCIFVVYKAGASGDLLASIIASHYLKSGCEYYGITDNGQVIFLPTDYKLTNTYVEKKRSPLFVKQWYYDIASCLAERNLNYSLLDQVIFSNHLYSHDNINLILKNLPNAKVINIFPQNEIEKSLIEYQGELKNNNIETKINLSTNEFNYSLITHPRVLNIPYGHLFIESKFENLYEQIVNFLKLNGKLIRFDYIQYYLSKQNNYFLENLNAYLTSVVNK